MPGGVSSRIIARLAGSPQSRGQISAGSVGSGSRTGASGFSGGSGDSLIGGGEGSAGDRRALSFRSHCMALRCRISPVRQCYVALVDCLPRSRRRAYESRSVLHLPLNASVCARLRLQRGHKTFSRLVRPAHFQKVSIPLKDASRAAFGVAVRS